MSVEAALHAVLAEVPVPGLSSAFNLFRFIVSSVQAVKESKKQLEVLAKGVGELLSTLNAQFKGSRLVAANCVKPLADLESLLQCIHRFVQRERDKAFLKSLLSKDSRINQIESFYRRIGLTVGAFHISSLLSVQDMLRNNETARIDDAGMLNAQLRGLQQNQDDLRNVLEINHNNMFAMMAALQRRLNVAPGNDQEQNFYSHTLQYLTSMSGRSVQLEDWMVASYDVEYGPEIGVGGFGKVYRGTWNRMEVAIKVLQNVAGVKANVVLLRKEVNIWLNLRHPHILQFLGANTLDDSPFLVMPYIPYNARQFLEQRPTFDPLYILRDVSLALQFMHSKRICHGDLKGVNILVEKSGRALLCDFGLSRIKADATSRAAHTASTVIAGSRNWMAPELLAGSSPKMPSDIYAFGMTLFELYTDETPLVNIAHTDFIELVFRSGVRPERPDLEDVPKLTDSLWTLAEKCWLQDAKARPTAGQIHALVVDIISETPVPSPGEHMIDSPGGTETRNHNHNLPGDIEASSKDQQEKLSAMSKKLANAHYDADQYKEAEELYPEVVKTQKHVLGADHPDTLLSMARLVYTYNELGKWKEAEELGLEVLEKRKQVLGVDHPYTLISMFTLAITCSQLGKWKHAEELELDVVKRQKQVLGADHPDTLRSMANLAITYKELEKWTQANQLGLEVFKRRTQALGINHPDTLRSMANLAITYNDLEKWKQAERFGQEVVERRKHVLGADHPDTLISMFNLAIAHSHLGKWDRAKELEQEVVKQWKRVLGADHPDTLQAMHNLAITCNSEELGLEVVKRRKQVLGVDHPDTLCSMANLASTYNYLRKWKEAEELGLDVVKTQKRVLGADHPDTFMSMLELAITCGKLGKWKEAEELELEVVKTRKQVLGADHPDTLIAMSNLVMIYRELGKHNDAEALSKTIKDIRKWS
ncbi:hypothetical protein B0H17DRAFT_1209097 [Mycena rosella]|uniref:Protein kinase domain-containing protein n=1 Tax=Mycena rosella TaxID=1033263 RepID=A0AAD7GA03_MYCRO|nr:hypothetical protein B0H17DRAFT_1209097 [Mycena rosella]